MKAKQLMAFWWYVKCKLDLPWNEEISCIRMVHKLQDDNKNVLGLNNIVPASVSRRIKTLWLLWIRETQNNKLSVENIKVKQKSAEFNVLHQMVAYEIHHAYVISFLLCF